jgi:hypothetical protein
VTSASTRGDRRKSLGAIAALFFYKSAFGARNGFARFLWNVRNRLASSFRVLVRNCMLGLLLAAQPESTAIAVKPVMTLAVWRVVTRTFFTKSQSI